MAVFAGIYGAEAESYTGCVLNTYEHNGYHDSDFYAVCWDEEKQEVVDVEYDTTRAGGGGYAHIDISDENLMKVYRYYKRMGRSHFDNVLNPRQAKEVHRGDEVVVVRGRKIPKGTTGKVFWKGKKYNFYSKRDEDRVGIEVGDEKLFLPLEYVEVIDWQSRLISGKERKQQIRNFAINSLPSFLRSPFVRWPS